MIWSNISYDQPASLPLAAWSLLKERKNVFNEQKMLQMFFLMDLIKN